MAGSKPWLDRGWRVGLAKVQGSAWEAPEPLFCFPLMAQSGLPASAPFPAPPGGALARPWASELSISPTGLCLWEFSISGVLAASIPKPQQDRKSVV